jgi:ABC-type multidrug transport system ATPase subunit
MMVWLNDLVGRLVSLINLSWTVILIYIGILTLAIAAGVAAYYLAMRLAFYFLLPPEVGAALKLASEPTKITAETVDHTRNTIAQAQDRARRVFRYTFIGVGVAAVFTIGVMIFTTYVDRAPVDVFQAIESAMFYGIIGFAIGAAAASNRLDSQFQYAMAALSTREKFIAALDEGSSKNWHEMKQAQREREQYLFRNNLSSVFEIKTFDVRNALMFSDLLWNLAPGVNVLLGRNGFGKSLLLRLMVGMMTYDHDRLSALLTDSSPDQHLTIRLLRNDSPASIERDWVSFTAAVGKIPVLAIPDSRFINRVRDGFAAEGDDFPDPAREGARHFLYELPYETRLQTVLAQMCIEYVNARDGKSGLRSRPSTPQLDLVAGVIEELSGERFQFESIEPIGNARFSISVKTDASPGKAIPFQRASQGTLSVVAIFALIYQFLRAVYGSIPDSELSKQPGIVIIDEVDAHLHPEWQRKIVELLRKRFPKIQFILTAHSPLVVAGCRQGEVAVLRRKDSVFAIRNIQRDFVGVTPEEIYRKVFEIEDRDERFLELQAQIPQLPALNKELEAMKNRKEADVSDLKERISDIQQTKENRKRL